MIKAVLFDIGDVLFNEDVQHTWLHHTCLLTLRKHGKAVTWDEWNAERIRRTSAGPDPEEAMEETLLAFSSDPIEGDKLWKEARAEYQRMRAVRPYGFLLNGIQEALIQLRPSFQLGVVANQHPPVADALEEYGVASLFDVIVISETVGLFKPNPAIFQFAAGKLGLDPSAIIFVGDRPDNDVRPAKSLGMKTIRFKRGLQYAHFNPEAAEMTADVTVTHVDELVPAIMALSGS